MPLPDKNLMKQDQVRKMHAIHTQRWYAWIEFNPSYPRVLHVSAEIASTSTALRAILLKKSHCPDYDTLCLALVVNQEKGEWPALDCLVTVRYEEVVLGSIYSNIHIYLEDALIEKIPVDIIAA